MIELGLEMTLKEIFWCIRLIEFPSIIAVTDTADRLFRMKYKNEKIRKARLAADFCMTKEQKAQNDSSEF